MDPSVILIIGLILIVGLYAAAYFYPPTHLLAKKYGLKIAVVLASVLGGIVIAMMFRRSKDTPSIEEPLKVLNAELKHTELEHEIRVLEAEATHGKEIGKHAVIKDEIIASKSLPTDERLAELARLSKKLYGA